MADSPEISKREPPKTMTRRRFLKVAVVAAGAGATATALSGCVQSQIDKYVEGLAKQTEEAKKTPTATLSPEEKRDIEIRDWIEKQPTREAEAREAREAFESALAKQIEDRGLDVTSLEVAGYGGKIQIVATDGAEIRNFPDHRSSESSVGKIQPRITMNDVDYIVGFFNRNIRRNEKWVVFTSTDLAMITVAVSPPFISLNEGYEENSFMVGERGKEKKYYFVCMSVGDDKIAVKTR